jgi:dTDP-4-dehydrorhamnose reductase
MTKRIGILGFKGHVGTVLLKYPNTFPLVADVTNPFEVEQVIKSETPDVVLNLAAISDADECEKDEKKAWNVNVLGALNVLETCTKYQRGCVLLSTSQVFSGKKLFGSSYSEYDSVGPKNYYGFSKLGAEQFASKSHPMKIVRTSYLFDYERMKSRIDELSKNDQHYPTFMKRSFMHLDHFCESLNRYLQHYDEMPDLLHISGSETVSWYQFMKDVSESFETKYRVVHRTKELEIYKTPRPYKSGLNNSLSYRLGFEMFSYYDGIGLMLERQL